MLAVVDALTESTGATQMPHPGVTMPGWRRPPESSSTRVAPTSTSWMPIYVGQLATNGGREISDGHGTLSVSKMYKCHAGCG